MTAAEMIRAAGEALGPAAVFGLGTAAGFLALPLGIAVFGRFFAEIAAPVIALVEAASAGAERIAQGLLAALAILVGLGVALRYVFGLSYTALGEAGLYAHGLCFLLAAPACLARGGHVRVDVFYRTFGPRMKAAVDFGAFHLFLAPMTLAIIHFSGPYVAGSWRIAERSPEADGLAILFLVKTAIPVFATLLLAQGLAGACRAALTLRGMLAPPAPEALRPSEGPA